VKKSYNIFGQNPSTLKRNSQFCFQ